MQQSGSLYDFGNPTSTAVVGNFIAGEKKILAPIFMRNSKQALTPVEYERLILEMTREARRNPGWIILSGMFRLEVSVGMIYAPPTSQIP